MFLKPPQNSSPPGIGYHAKKVAQGSEASTVECAGSRRSSPGSIVKFVGFGVCRRGNDYRILLPERRPLPRSACLFVDVTLPGVQSADLLPETFNRRPQRNVVLIVRADQR